MAVYDFHMLFELQARGQPESFQKILHQIKTEISCWGVCVCVCRIVKLESELYILLTAETTPISRIPESRKVIDYNLAQVMFSSFLIEKVCLLLLFHREHDGCTQ